MNHSIGWSSKSSRQKENHIMCNMQTTPLMTMACWREKAGAWHKLRLVWVPLHSFLCFNTWLWNQLLWGYISADLSSLTDNARCGDRLWISVWERERERCIWVFAYICQHECVSSVCVCVCVCVPVSTEMALCSGADGRATRLAALCNVQGSSYPTMSCAQTQTHVHSQAPWNVSLRGQSAILMPYSS